MIHRRMLAVALATTCFTLLLAGPSVRPSSAAPRDPMLAWLSSAADPAAVRAALSANPHKIPAEFVDRLEYAQPDGTLLVMVALKDRNEQIASFVRDSVSWLSWYPKAPRFVGRVTPQQLSSLLESPHVTFVEPDYPLSYFLSTSVVSSETRGLRNNSGVWSFNDPNDSLPYGALRSEVPGLSTAQVTGSGVVVAVSDSGIDKTHRDFGGFDCDAGPLSHCESRIVRSVVVDSLVTTPLDAGDVAPTTDLFSGHGTHVAGIVAGNGYYTRESEPAVTYEGDGRMIGMAPQASLLSVKLGDSQSAALGSQALQWTANNAERYGIRVSTNSWGCARGCSFNPRSAVAQTIKDLYSKGVLVTIAVGNSNGDDLAASGDGGFSGNAQSPYALGVAAYDHRSGQLAGFSSRGVSTSTLDNAATWRPEQEPEEGQRRPDLAAPGIEIWSAASLTGGTSSLFPRGAAADVGANEYFPFNYLAYGPMSGTSMATPHVAGAAAILFSACPAAEPLDAMRALKIGASTSPVLDTEGTRRAEPFEAGYGALNTRASLDWLLGQPFCTGEDIPPAPEAPPAPLPDPNPDSPAANGSIFGKVRNARTNEPIKSALVDCGDGLHDRTDPRGVYTIDEVDPGQYSCTARSGKMTSTKTVTVSEAASKRLNFKLRR